MRFMVMVRADEKTEAGVMPSQELLEAMGRYNQELANAGVMLAGEGLHPSSRGARVRFTGGQPVVTDGPFPETKELIAGFWLWKCASPGAEVEIRPVFEAEDFGEALTPELREQGARLRAEAAARS